MGKYFGTDGFRGEAGITLTADHAYKVGRFLGWYYNALRERNGNNEPAHIVIGKDTRRSSYMFEYSLVAGLTASGADAYLLHVTTTPSVAYIARVDDFDCGIMISASHNPYYDNGIKLIDCYGEKMPEEIRGRIRMDCSYAVRLLMEAVDKLYIMSGAAGLSLKGSLQRAARDLHAINMHALLLFETSAEVYGRILLGKGSNTGIY